MASNPRLSVRQVRRRRRRRGIPVPSERTGAAPRPPRPGAAAGPRSHAAGRTGGPRHRRTAPTAPPGRRRGPLDRTTPHTTDPRVPSMPRGERRVRTDRRRAVPSRGPGTACLPAPRAGDARDVGGGADGGVDAGGLEQRQCVRGTTAAGARGAHVVDPRPDQAVAGAQLMIEKGERPVARQRREPERQTREFHRHRVRVDAEEAPSRHQAPELGAVVLREVAAGHGSLVDERRLVGRGEIAARGDQKRAAAHRGIENAQREDPFRRRAVDERRQRAPHEVLRQRPRRVERAGGLCGGCRVRSADPRADGRAMS